MFLNLVIDVVLNQLVNLSVEIMIKILIDKVFNLLANLVEYQKVDIKLIGQYLPSCFGKIMFFEHNQNFC